MAKQESITLDYNYMLKPSIGEAGFTETDIEALKDKFSKSLKNINKKRLKGEMDFFDLPFNQEKVATEILAYCDSIYEKIESFVVLGIGGSALGPMAVHQAINHPFYNELTKEERGGFPKLYVADNVDPERLSGLFDVIDIEKSLFNCVSKSGSTSETMSQFMIIKDMLEKRLGKESAKEHIVCTTDKENGNLIKIAKEEGYKTFYIPSGVGGRFSELTPVGLLPAAMCGIDIKKLLSGAACMEKVCENEDVFKNPAGMYALLNYMGMKKGYNISVMMPYADSLRLIADWYAQLWAESLGKKYDNEGNVINCGQTPVKALGVTDQHSQVQLYTEGPFDKIIVFIGLSKFKKEIKIPKVFSSIPSLGFLGGLTHSQLISVEQKATEYALKKGGRPSMTITLPEVNEFTLGQLLFFFEAATAFAGELLNINAFDQPGVEEGKNATYAMFGRPGYEEKRNEMENIPEKNKKYII